MLNRLARLFRRRPKVEPTHFCHFCGGKLIKRYRPSGFNGKTGRRLPDVPYWTCSQKAHFVCAHVTELHVE